ncbi:MAG: glycosyltransferase [Phycisphaerales bacterium]|nr:glycosyltransferase [Phycisphaerales bacterium]
MKFIINTTNLQSGGALQVASSLLEEWNKNSAHEFHVFLSPQLSAVLEQNKLGQNLQFYEFKNNPTSNIKSLINNKSKLKKLELKIKPDAVLTVFGPAIWKPQKPHLVGFANGYYLFDDSNFIQQGVLTNIFKRIKYYSRRFLLFRQLKKEANYYWVETALAQNKLAAIISEDIRKIEIIGNTYGTSFNMERTPKHKTNNTFNLLYVSAYYPHKNFEIIPSVIEILAYQKVNCRFICTLPQKEFEGITRHVKNLNFIKNVGPCRQEALVRLYSEADAVFMPSLLETYSANYLEAMKMELPIICSNFDFSRTICGDAALYFDAQNPEDIAHKIVELINNEKLRNYLINAGKKRLAQLETPESRANKLLTLLENIALENPKQ